MSQVLSFDRLAYSGCIRSLSVLSPYQIVLARGSQVEYFFYKEAIKQWILHSSCFFGFIQQNYSLNVPCSASSVNDKSDNVCGLSGCLLLPNEGSTCIPFVTRPTIQNFEESTYHSPFIVFAFGLHFFQMFQFTTFAKSQTIQPIFENGTEPVFLTSGSIHLTEARVLDVQLVLKETKFTNEDQPVTGRFPNEDSFLKLHGSLIAVCSAYNCIDIHSLCVEKDTLQLSVTPSLKKIKGPVNTLLFSFALATLVSPCNTSQTLFRCAAGTMDGRILLWTYNIEMKFPSSICERLELTVSDVFNYHVIQDSGGILKLKFFLDAEILVSASETRIITVWQTTPHKPHCYSLTSRMKQHTARVWDIAGFRREDKDFNFISVGEDNQWFLWNLKGLCSYRMKAHVGRGITCVAFPTMLDNSMPSFFVTAGLDGDVKLWPLHFFQNQSTSKQLADACFSKKILSPSADQMILYPYLHLQTCQDTVRDVVITKNETYFITDTGKLLRIFHGSPCNVPFNLDSWTVAVLKKTSFVTSHSQKLYFEHLITFPFILTGTSLSHVETENSDIYSKNMFSGSFTPPNTFLVMGTVCGKCCVSLIGCPHCLFSSDFPFQTRNALQPESYSRLSELSSCHCLLIKKVLWNATFCVFANVRVQRTFSEPLVAQASWNLSLGSVHVIAVTSHDGSIHIYWVDIFCALACSSNEKLIHTLMSSKEREKTGIHHLFSGRIPPQKNVHSKRIFSFAMLPFLYDKTLSTTADPQKLLQLSLFFGDEHGSVSFGTIRIFLRLRKLFQHPFNNTTQPWLPYYTFSSAEPPSELKSISLAKRNFCKIHCIRVHPSVNSTINTLYATANNGILYTCSFHFDHEKLNTTSPCWHSNLNIKKIIQFKQFHVIYDLLNFNEEKQQFAYIACFRGSDFIVWCTSSETEVWRFPCGGSRRPFRIHYVEKYFTPRTLKIFKCASIQRGVVTLYRKSWQEVEKSSHQQPMCLLNQPCLSLFGSSHGREIWCAVWLTPSYLCTAGETGSLYEYALKAPLSANSALQQKHLQTVGAHHHSTTALRCVALTTYDNISFLVFGGAKQFLLLYVYDRNQQAHEGSLLKKWQLALPHDERISCVSCFLQPLSPLHFSLHLSPRSETDLSSLPELHLCFHIITGTSSGKLLHETVYLEKVHDQFKSLEFLQPRTSHDLVSPLFQPKHSIVASLSSAILCSQFQFVNSKVTSDSTYGLYHCGCVNGSISTYSVSYAKDVTKLTWSCLLQVQAHQVGTTCLAVSPLICLLQPNDETTLHVFNKQTPTWTFYLASGGDDNSVTVQYLQLTWNAPHPLYQILYMTRIPRAHISSVRGLCWSDHLLVSVGWDKKIRFWKVSLTTSSLSTVCGTDYHLKSSLLADFPFGKQTPSCISLELLQSISTQIGDTAGVAAICPDVPGTPQSKSCVSLRLAVFGAHGIEIVDAVFKPELQIR